MIIIAVIRHQKFSCQKY